MSYNLSLSTLIKDYCGIEDICLSIPSIVNKKGVEKVLAIGLSAEEQRKLKASALALRKIKGRVGLQKYNGYFVKLKKENKRTA